MVFLAIGRMRLFGAFIPLPFIKLSIFENIRTTVLCDNAWMLLRFYDKSSIFELNFWYATSEYVLKRSPRALNRLIHNWYQSLTAWLENAYGITVAEIRHLRGSFPKFAENLGIGMWSSFSSWFCCFSRNLVSSFKIIALKRCWACAVENVPIKRNSNDLLSQHRLSADRANVWHTFILIRFWRHS